ncbi:MAG: hypothetical protein WCW93_03905 [Candidatus Paceibacterota bacterium]|jgi:hypothetical protein
MIKTTGLEFKRFYDDSEVWVDGAYHDDLELYINGTQWMGDTDLEVIDNTDKIRIGSGVILYDDGTYADFCKVFRGWLKKQTTVILTVEVPKEKAQILESGIKGMGGRIV